MYEQENIKLKTFREKYQYWEQKVDEAEQAKESVDRLIFVVLEQLGLNIKRIGIPWIAIDNDTVELTITWSSSGYMDSEDVKFPLSLLESDNPKEAAKQYHNQLEEKKRKEQLAAKRKQLERLKIEIGE